MTVRAGGWCGGVAAVLLFGSLVFAQDAKKPETKSGDQKAEVKAEAKAEKAKKAQNRLPNNFAKLSLTDEQKKKIYGVQAAHAAKIVELMAQLKAAREKEQAEIDAVLTPEQLKLLESIRTESKAKQEAAAKAKAAEKKAEDAAAKPEAEKKPTEKK